MNENEMLIQNIIKDVEETVKNNPTKAVCIWWRGRVSGIAAVIMSEDREHENYRLNKLVEMLYEAEDKANR